MSNIPDDLDLPAEILQKVRELDDLATFFGQEFPELGGVLYCVVASVCAGPPFLKALNLICRDFSIKAMEAIERVAKEQVGDETVH